VWKEKAFVTTTFFQTAQKGAARSSSLEFGGKFAEIFRTTKSLKSEHPNREPVVKKIPFADNATLAHSSAR
jgi:hypothetical protein